jgi:hypothetical protein
MDGAEAPPFPPSIQFLKLSAISFQLSVIAHSYQLSAISYQLSAISLKKKDGPPSASGRFSICRRLLAKI